MVFAPSAMAGADRSKIKNINRGNSIELIRLVTLVTPLLCALFITDMVIYWSKY